MDLKPPLDDNVRARSSLNLESRIFLVSRADAKLEFSNISD